MVGWERFREQAPELAAAVRERFDAHGHKTMATIRADGSPRISGTEVQFRDGQLWLGGMPGSRKCLDLRRDGRVAIHSGSDDPDAWTGDAKIAGSAVEVTDEQVIARFADGAPPGPFHLFRIELTEAVVVSLGRPADHLVIESWHEGRGTDRVERS
ncbi:MAG: pyridoxamine 5'-phosphate oxidase [Pseudonocardiaceae bacterium]|nr:pyridoxamine 5'-phosphate oxidase [Pseudonocardiaceae bacterium]